MSISKVSFILRLLSLTVILLISIISAPTCHARSNPGEVDIFAGVDFRYRDIHFRRLFDVLLCVTPGARWSFAPGWDVAAQLYVPLYNTMGDSYKAPKLNVASLAYQRNIGGRVALKGSAGIFSAERYGLDLKGMWMLTPWLALEGETGLTGYGRYTLTRIDYSAPTRWSGQLGGAIWLAPWSVLMRGRAGRYCYGDWGCDAEMMRHFRHTTVGLKGRWSQEMGLAFGFNITVMLPSTSVRYRNLRIRPAAAFELSYTNRSDYNTNTLYRTDPEENVREGWFSPTVAPWGPYKSTTP